MHPAAIEHARSRLRSARKALADLKASQDPESFEGAWYNFLTAAKGVYTKLQVGANTTKPESRTWYSAKTRDRNNDPLLSYVYEARNAEEHGLDPSVRRHGPSLSIGVAEPGYSTGVQLRTAPDGRLHISSTNEKPVLVRQNPAYIALVSVKPRGRKAIPPPQEHLGKPIQDNLPIPVAELVVTYLEGLINEAAGLA